MSFGQLEKYEQIKVVIDTNQFVFHEDTTDINRRYNFLTIDSSFYFKSFTFCFGKVSANTQWMMILDKNKKKIQELGWHGAGLSKPRFYAVDNSDDISFVFVEERSSWTWAEYVFLIKDGQVIFLFMIDIGYSDDVAVQTGVAPIIHITKEKKQVLFKFTKPRMLILHSGEFTEEILLDMTSKEYCITKK